MTGADVIVTGAGTCVRTHAVPASAVPALRANLATAHRRATRAGHAHAAPTLVVEATELRRRCAYGHGFQGKRTACDVCGGYTALVEVALVRLDAPPPVIAGWEFIAAIEPLGQGSLIRRVPGAAPDVSLEAYRPRELAERCEHCHTKRRRTLTFVLRRTTDGHLLQVGRTCLHAHLGEDPDDIIARMRWADILDRADSEEGEGGWGRAPTEVHTEEYLACVAAVIATDGWVSATAARERGLMSTAHLAWDVAVPLVGDPPERRRWREERAPCEADRDLAAAALAAGRAAEGTSEYILNLRLVAQEPRQTRRTIGFAAALVSAEVRRRSEAAAATAAARGPGRAPAHLGKVGERLRNIPVTVTEVRVMSGGGSRFASTLIKFRTDDGAVIAWFASGADWSPDLVGQQRRIALTVKAHTAFRNVPETRASRVVFDH